MFGNPFYNALIRKYVVAFGNLFNNITMIRYRQDRTTEVDRMIVPLSYGPKEKFISKITQDPDLNRNTQTLLPRMSFEIVGMAYDPMRKQETNLKYRSTIPGTSNRARSRYIGTPYDINFELSIMVRNIEDGNQIVEQILPYFSPEYSLSLNLLSDFPDDIRTIPVTLNAVNQSIDYEGDYESTRMIIWTLSFTMKAYVFGPTSTQNVITTAITNIFDSSGKYKVPSDQITLNMNDLAGNATYKFDDIVYQGSNPQDAFAVGQVLDWIGSPYNRLTLKLLGGAFKLNSDVWAVSTNASGQILSFQIPDQKAVTIRVTPNPITANANSDYGYTTQITEFPYSVIPYSDPYHDGFGLDFVSNTFFVRAAGGGTGSEYVVPFTTAWSFTRTANTSNAATFIGSNRFLQFADVNVPRIEYNVATGNCQGLLIEGMRTNFFQQSANLSQGAWSKSEVTVSSNTTTAPDGVTPVAALFETVTNTIHRPTQTVSVTSGVIYTCSIFVKDAGRRYVSIQFNTGFPASSHAFFDLQTGTISQLGSGLSNTSIVPYANGFYRISATANATSTTTTTMAFNYSTDGGSSTFYVGDTTKGFYFYGGQFEQGAFPSSLIITNTSAITRGADQISRTYGTEYSPSVGTVFVEYDVIDATANASGIILACGDDGRHVYTSNGLVSSYDGTTVVSATPAIPTRSSVKVAAAQNTSGQAIVVGSGSIATGSRDPAFGSGTTLYIGGKGDGTLTHWGHLKRLHYRPERLPNANLTAYTAG